MNSKLISIGICILGALAIQSTGAVDYQSITDYATTHSNVIIDKDENGDPQSYTFSGRVAGTKSQRIDLRGFDFSTSTIEAGTIFSYVDFSGAIFAPLTSLEDTQFIRCQLVGTIFIMSSLDGAIFRYSNLQDAIFNFAIITDTIFDTCILKTAHITPAEISNTIFSMSNMDNINLSNTTLKNVLFTNMTTLVGAFFANLDPASTDVYFGTFPADTTTRNILPLAAAKSLGITPADIVPLIDLTMSNFTDAQGVKVIFAGDDTFGITMTNAILVNTAFSNPDFDNICVAKADEETCENSENLDDLRQFILSGGAD